MKPDVPNALNQVKRSDLVEEFIKSIGSGQESYIAGYLDGADNTPGRYDPQVSGEIFIQKDLLMAMAITMNRSPSVI